MTHKPVHVFISGKELLGYTNLNLKREKSSMTGELSIGIFMGWMPEAPVLNEVNTGQEILVYIAGHLAFTGFIDRRKDASEKGGTTSLSVGPTNYSITFTARGKTKLLVDSSHQHPTGTMLRPSSRTAIESLIAPWKINLDWQADIVEIDRIRFRDGSNVVDEIQRIAEQFSLFVYETRDGLLKVIDKPETSFGEDISLGTNILSFSTDQLADNSRSLIVVKGQLTSKESWGESAVLPTLKKTVSDALDTLSTITVQAFGNATEEVLDRRAQYEVNKRNSAAKKITLEVFHVQQTDGSPWDIGVQHRISIPPAGIEAVMELVSINYTVTSDKTLKTELTFSPPPVQVQPKPSSENLSSLPEITDIDPVEGAWCGPSLTVQTEDLSLPEGTLGAVPEIGEASPPLSLPIGFGE